MEKVVRIDKSKYSVSFSVKKNSLCVKSGAFEDMQVLESPLFYVRLKNVKSGEDLEISSTTEWATVSVEQTEADEYAFRFVTPKNVALFCITLNAKADETGVSWNTEVFNDNEEWSVMEITYPSLEVGAEYFDLFMPRTCGCIIKNAGIVGVNNHHDPQMSMQFSAVYGKNGGLYLGTHDGKAAMKYPHFIIENNRAKIYSWYYGENGTKGANSFKLSGVARWQALKGDWYDASQIYAEFVKKEAEWLPAIDKNGRMDTPAKYKEIPFWVCDYIPNSAKQRDNKPKKLSAGSDCYEKGYWYNAVIELQKELGVPIAYHVYNWHEISFNVDYPHFLPAKDEFEIGLKELKKHDIYVMPYINALSWESRDNFSGEYEITFENTGKYGAVMNVDGSLYLHPYPQTHDDNVSVLLASMCSSWEKWHSIIEEVTVETERRYDLDGIYFDQVAATHGWPCYNPEHGHTLGGGTYWVDGYTKMMERINAKKTENSFYFTERNSEEFAKLFDGFLTWEWVINDDVPAFPAVYAGYIQMIGRCTLGEKKDDIEFFQYLLAKSFLYGQQLGWAKADCLYNERKLASLKELVPKRNQYAKLFNSAKMLRPPVITCSFPSKITSKAMQFKDDIVMEQALAGAWQYRDGSKTVIFAINVAESENEYALSFDVKEYKLKEEKLIALGFEIDENGKASISGVLQPLECKAWEI